MVRTSLVVFLLLLIIGCSTSDKNRDKNVRLIETYVRAVQDLDHDIMAKSLHDDYLGLGPSYTDSIGKGAAIENWKEHTENLYEKIEYKNSRTIAVHVGDGENKGEWVSNWADLHITYKNDMGNVTLFANTIYKIQDGQIIRSYTFYNEADALRQLDYTFIRPNTK